MRHEILCAAAGLAFAVPIEYSHVKTEPYRCAPCYGAMYVDKVKACVEKFDCSNGGTCRVVGEFGVENLGVDLVESSENFVIFSGKALPTGYSLRRIELEVEDPMSNRVPPQALSSMNGITVSFLSAHNEVVAQNIMLKSSFPTSTGELILFEPEEVTRTTPYIRLDWSRKKGIRRVVAEYRYDLGRSCAYQP